MNYNQICYDVLHDVNFTDLLYTKLPDLTSYFVLQLPLCSLILNFLANTQHSVCWYFGKMHLSE